MICHLAYYSIFFLAGPLYIDGGQLSDEVMFQQLGREILAQFDKRGVGFPIRALVLGPRAFQSLLSRNRGVRRENDYLVTQIINQGREWRC